MNAFELLKKKAKNELRNSGEFSGNSIEPGFCENEAQSGLKLSIVHTGQNSATERHGEVVPYNPAFPELHGCASCESHENGWCLLVKPKSRYNVHCIRICPRRENGTS